MASDVAQEPFMVDGMLVTAASELPPEAGDVANYTPAREPVTLYGRFGRGRPILVDDQGEELDEKAGASWREDLRRQVFNVGHPKKSVLDIRCGGRDRHRLLWLVPSTWGLVPISHTADEPDDADVGPLLTWTPFGGNAVIRKPEPVPEPEPAPRFTSHFHGEDVETGRPLTLGEWPADRPLPPASCPCYAEVPFTADDVRRRLARRNETYRGSSPTV